MSVQKLHMENGDVGRRDSSGLSWTWISMYTVFQKKTSTHIIGCKLRNSCPILIIFDIKIPHII